MTRSHDGPLASVVVPCKGHAAELAECLRSLAAQETDFAYETIVVDSASDPEVASVVARVAGVRLVRGDTPLFPGPARNLGVRGARGDLVAFIDADCRADGEWLAHAVRALDDGVEMVGGPVVDALPWHPVAVADNMLQFADLRPGRPDGPARYFPACNMAMRRASFLAVGGFPDVGLVAGEDTSLCERVAERWPDGIRFVRGMRVRHDGRTRFGEFLRHQRHFGYARGVLGLHLTPTLRRWGAHTVALPAVVLKRLIYVSVQNVRWDPLGAVRMIPLLPLAIVGLTAWATGFRQGCREIPRPEAMP